MQKALCEKIILGMLLLFFAVGSSANVGIPDHQHWVTDTTGTLTIAEIAELEARLVRLEQDTHVQLAILLVHTTGAESIEQYAIRVFEKWKLGRKGVDDGLLFVAAISDQRMKIEVGYGLEALITDAVASRIIRDSITPEFKEGRFYQGISLGVDNLIAQVGGEGIPLVAGENEKSASVSQLLFSLLFSVVFGSVLGFIAYLVLKIIVEPFVPLFRKEVTQVITPGGKQKKHGAKKGKGRRSSKSGGIQRRSMVKTVFSPAWFLLVLISYTPFYYLLLELSLAEVQHTQFQFYTLLGVAMAWCLFVANFRGCISFRSDGSSSSSSDSGSSWSSSSSSSFDSSSSSSSSGGGSSGGGGASGSW